MERTIILFITILILLSVFQITAIAEEEYEEELPNKGTFFGCKYCHVRDIGGEELNFFGIGFEANNLTYNETLGAMDSDGDGFTNDEEFSAEPGTNPGDPQSYPEKEPDILVYVLIIGVITAITVGFVVIWKIT